MGPATSPWYLPAAGLDPGKPHRVEPCMKGERPGCPESEHGVRSSGYVVRREVYYHVSHGYGPI